MKKINWLLMVQTYSSLQGKANLFGGEGIN